MMKLILAGRVTDRARVLQMALRKCGVTNADVCEAFSVTPANVTAHFDVLQKHGYVARDEKVKGERLRFRATDAGRAALTEAGICEPWLPEVVSPIRVIGFRKPSQQAAAIHSRALGKPGRDLVVPVRPAHDAPVRISNDRTIVSGKPVFPSGSTVVQGKAAGYDPRYQCAPGEQPWGAGFAAAGIGRDIATGRQWGQ
jgi:hypothetical protein